MIQYHMVSYIDHRKTMLVGGGALHAPPALLRGAPPQFDLIYDFWSALKLEYNYFGAACSSSVILLK
jgi:hypothetical protein